MKKHLFAILLTVAMAVCLLSTTALAEECTNDDSCQVHAAKIGNVHYDSLDNAITAVKENASETTTITLLQDVNSAVTIPATKNVTLDLNGKSVEVTDANAITNNGTLNIAGKGKVSALTSGKSAISNGSYSNPASLTVGTIGGDDGKLEIYGATYAVNGYGTMTLYSGSYEGKTALYVGTGATANVSGGSFTGKLSGTGTTNITGGTFTADPSNYVGANKVAKSYEQGKYVIEDLAPEAAEARIGTSDYYASFTVALTKAIAGQTVSVTKDLSLSRTSPIEISKDLTIDFQNHEVTTTINQTAFRVTGGGHTVTFQNGTIKNESSATTFTIQIGSSAVLENMTVTGSRNAISNSGTVTLKSGTYTSTSDATSSSNYIYAVSNDGDMTIYEGVTLFNGKNASDIDYICGSSNNVTLLDAEEKDNYVAKIETVDNAKKVTFVENEDKTYQGTDGEYYKTLELAIEAENDEVTLVRKLDALTIPAGANLTLNLSGKYPGTLTVPADANLTLSVTSGGNYAGDITNSGTLTMNLAGGCTYKGTITNSCTMTVNMTDNSTLDGTIVNTGTVTIVGGNVTTQVNSVMTGTGTYTLGQGNYTSLPPTGTWSCAENYICEAKSGGTYTVGTLKASIGEAQYTSLQNAVDAANSGETVKLEANDSGKLTIPATFQGTLDLNGKEWEGTNGGKRPAIQVAEGAQVIIKNGTIYGAYDFSGNTNSYPYCIENQGNLTIDNVKLYGGSKYQDGGEKTRTYLSKNALVRSNGTLTIQNSEIINRGDYAPDGEMDGGIGVLVYGGTANITGSTIYGGHNGVKATGGTVTIGGNSTVEYYVSDHTEGEAAVLAVADGTIKIQDGTYNFYSAEADNTDIEGYCAPGYQCQMTYKDTTNNCRYYTVSPIYLSVTFDSDGGSDVAAQTVQWGNKAQKPEDLTKEGFTFAGWFIEGAQTSFDFTTEIKQNTALKAHWTAITYSVSFDSNGGEAVSQQTIGYKEKATVPATPIKTGYTFDGWFAAEESTAFDFTQVITADTALTAHWTMTNSLTLSADATTAAYGTAVQLYVAPANSNWGYTWYKDANGNGTLEVSADTVLSNNCSTCTLNDVAESGTYWVLAMDGKNTASSNAITVDITQATPTITLTDKSTTYTGSPIEIDAATVTGVKDGDTSAGKVTYTYYSGNTPLDSAPTDAGSYTVTAHVAAAGNYAEATSSSATLTIQNATFAVTATGYSGIYDGKAHSATVTAEGATITYKTSEEAEYTADNPTFTTVGTYTVYYKATKANHNDVEGSVSVVIAKATPTPTITANPTALTGRGTVTLTVAGIPAETTGTVTCDDVTVTANADGTYSATLPNRSQTYTFTVSSAESTNYTAATAACTVSVEYYELPTVPASTGTNGSTTTKPSTDTVTNEDGSTTVTETSKDGTVTVTDTAVDGSTKVTETAKDGSSKVTETAVDGSTKVTETAKDGSSKVTETATDGATKVTETAKDGATKVTETATDGATKVTETATDGATKVTETATDGAVKITEKTTDGTVTINDTSAKGIQVITVAAPQEDVKATVTLPEEVTEATVVIPTEKITAGLVAVDAETGEVLKLSAPTEDGLALLVDGNVSVVLVDNSKDFEDVAEEHWGSDAIDFASSRELFQGTTETTFEPEEDMTRAMILTVLARLDGQDTTTGETWYENAVEWAKENEISDGTDLEGSVTREQLATMLYRYAGEPEPTQETLSFDDADQVSDWAQKALLWANENGIINGKGDGILDPTGTATRAEVAQLLKNYISFLTR